MTPLAWDNRSLHAGQNSVHQPVGKGGSVFPIEANDLLMPCQDPRFQNGRSRTVRHDPRNVHPPIPQSGQETLPIGIVAHQ
jgi:hypothetical protein